jgi:hypothetical protein
VVWGKKKKVRSPKTGKRVYKPRPEAEWVKTEIPEQRIISDDLWARSTARRGLVNRVYATANTRAGMPRSTAMNSPYLFSGLLKCSDCGANITILWGKGRNKTSQAYGCPMNWNRGETVGKNTVRIQRGDLEAALLGGLQELILREDVIDYVLEKFEVELRKALQLIGDEMEVMRRRKAELEAEIANLVTALAKGSKSPAIIGEITKREQEISDISDRLLSAKPDSIHSRIDKMRLMATAQMRNVRELLRGDVTLARAELLKHVSKIVLKPDGKTYVAEGNWKLLGDTTQGWCRGPESNVAASRSSRSH